MDLNNHRQEILEAWQQVKDMIDNVLSSDYIWDSSAFVNKENIGIKVSIYGLIEETESMKEDQTGLFSDNEWNEGIEDLDDKDRIKYLQEQIEKINRYQGHYITLDRDLQEQLLERIAPQPRSISTNNTGGY